VIVDFLSLPGLGGSNYTNGKINQPFLNIELPASLRHSLFLDAQGRANAAREPGVAGAVFDIRYSLLPFPGQELAKSYFMINRRPRREALTPYSKKPAARG